MRFVRILINAMLFVIAHAISKLDDQSTTEDSSDNFSLDLFNSDSITTSDHVDPDYNFAPSKMNVGSSDILDPDKSSGTENSLSMSDSSKCAVNLGKREDSIFSVGNYSLLKERHLFKIH